MWEFTKTRLHTFFKMSTRLRERFRVWSGFDSGGVEKFVSQTNFGKTKRVTSGQVDINLLTILGNF